MINEWCVLDENDVVFNVFLLGPDCLVDKRNFLLKFLIRKTEKDLILDTCLRLYPNTPKNKFIPRYIGNGPFPGSPGLKYNREKNCFEY